MASRILCIDGRRIRIKHPAAVTRTGGERFVRFEGFCLVERHHVARFGVELVARLDIGERFLVGKGELAL
jgi:hypothetical protein